MSPDAHNHDLEAKIWRRDMGDIEGSRGDTKITKLLTKTALTVPAPNLGTSKILMINTVAPKNPPIHCHQGPCWNAIWEVSYVTLGLRGIWEFGNSFTEFVNFILDIARVRELFVQWQNSWRTFILRNQISQTSLPFHSRNSWRTVFKGIQYLNIDPLKSTWPYQEKYKTTYSPNEKWLEGAERGIWASGAGKAGVDAGLNWEG